MRFSPGHRYAFTDTSRKRAAVLVRQRKDREKFPLFAELVAETQPSVDEVMEARGENWARAVARTRSERAAAWARARLVFSAVPEPYRAALLIYWNSHRWLPGDPTYLLGELRRWALGDLVLHEGRIVDADRLRWERARDAKIAALSDADLDRMIQTHISPMFVDLARAERLRRANAIAQPAPDRARRRLRPRLPFLRSGSGSRPVATPLPDPSTPATLTAGALSRKPETRRG